MMMLSEKLDKNNIADVIALTPMQEGMLFHYLKDPESGLYFEQLSLNISGTIDFKIFTEAWQLVLVTNEMLRTVFRWQDVKEPVQIVLKECKFKPGYLDISALKESEKNKSLDNIRIKDRSDKFDLASGAFRVILVKISAANYELIISNHHILYDGWSTGIILKEFFSHYSDLSAGRQPVKPVKSRFKEFILRQQNNRIAGREQFWREYLTGFDTVRQLAVKKTPGKAEDNPPAGSLDIKLDKGLSGNLRRFGRERKITLAALFYTVHGILLRKYNNSNDVLFGTTVSGRKSPLPGIADMVGLFINTLPVRVQGDSSGKVVDLLTGINETIQQREAYETTPLVDIKKYSPLPGSEELFDTLVVIENYPVDNKFTRGSELLTVNSYEAFETTNYDLAITISLTGRIGIKFIYNRNRLEKEVLQRLASHFTNIIKDIISNPGKPAAGLNILSAAEKNQLLFDFNKTEAAFPAGKKIHELFTEQAAKTPGNIAVVSPGPGSSNVQVTYEKVNTEAGLLAGLLNRKSAAAGCLIGVLFDRSLEMIVGILAVLKAGAGYLPIDPGYPEERKRYILKDSRTKLLLTTRSFSGEVEKLRSLEVETVFIEECRGEAFPFFSSSECFAPTYAIYTSGSTGKPKGVLVEHKSLVNIIFALQAEYPLTESGTYLFKTSYVFDVSAAELFGWFSAGGRLAILEKNGEKEPKKIIAAIARALVTHINFVPVMFNLFVAELNADNIDKIASLKYIFVAGEELLPGLVEEFRHLNTNIPLENIYGPTEGTIYSAKYSLSGWPGRGTIPIGKPMRNIKLYIVDKADNLQTLGAPGELCIAGENLAPGYLNQPELTAEKFIASGGQGAFLKNRPLHPQKTSVYELPSNQECRGEPCVRPSRETVVGTRRAVPEGLLYRSGDLARWLPDGNIEFLGRIDHQVKIRGFRIELGEIESRLLKHEAVKEVVVVVIKRQEEQEGKYLCAYMVGKECDEAAHNNRPSSTQLREFLSPVLPGYMIPSYFVFIEKMPLTTTGKIDRKILPEPEIESTAEYRAPRSQAEEKLVKIYAEILGMEFAHIGIDDDFFALGGHSLTATRLIARIHKQFAVSVPLAEFFNNATISWLSGYTAAQVKDELAAVKAVEKKEYYPLSPAQKRMYLLQQLEPAGTVYNITGVFQPEQAVSRKELTQIFRKLIRRHESFRTSCHMINDIPVQKVHREVEFEIDSLPGIGVAVRPFDLSKAPLMRVGMPEVESGVGRLFIDMHHIIADAVSIAVLVEEFNELLNGQDLPGLRLQYRDYAAWQGREEYRQMAKKQEAYWLKRFAHELPVLNLPVDYPRPAVQSYAGSSINFLFSPGEEEIARKTAQHTGTTLYMVILSLFNILLSKLSGEEDIVVGTPAAARRHADLTGVVGMFVNTLPVRSYPLGRKSYREFLNEVKHTALEAFEHQEYPFELLVEKLQVPRDTGRSPVFAVMFNLLNYEDYAREDLEQLEASEYLQKEGAAKYDLTLTIIDRGDKLYAGFEYCTKLFKAGTIRRFTGYFRKLLAQISENKEKPITDIEIITAAEKWQMLYEFNDTEVSHPLNGTIHELFAGQVEKTPDSIAVVCADKMIGYRQLHKKSDRLAGVLTGKGVKPGTIVGIMAGRSLEMIVCIFGILKSGAAYLPIEPGYPEERKHYLLKDSGAEFLLTDSPFKSLQVDTVSVEERRGEPCVRPTGKSVVGARRAVPSEPETCNPQPVTSPLNLAYVIYTSGSTGFPKGVLVEHGPVVNLLFALQKQYPLIESDTYLLKTSYMFDVSVTELFGWYLAGGKLSILTPGGEKDPYLILDEIEKNKVTHINFVPSMFNAFVDILTAANTASLSQLKYIFLAGEALPARLVDKFNNFVPDISLENLYGPTEATVYASLYSLPGSRVSRDIPIGKPVSGVNLFILDRYDKLQGVGIAGELCIGGAGLSRGYLNRLELTAVKFITAQAASFKPQARHGFHMSHTSYKSYLYKTGDLARWLPDGNIEFLGRKDQQVKIRGFRIELAEIESLLLKEPGIEEAVVIAIGEELGQNYLCGYMVSQHELNIPELKNRLANSLPGYMIPAHFVRLDRIPLTASGKIDRKLLPVPGFAAGADYAAPRDDVEKRLAEIWSQVLKIDKSVISIHGNFFAYGGHSLKAAILAAGIHREFNVKIALIEIFKRATIAGLARYLTASSKKKYAAIEPVEKREYYKLSAAQKRMYLLQQFDVNSTVYNIFGVVNPGHEITKEDLTAVFKKLIERHQVLRTSFEIVKEEPVQRVHHSADMDFEIEYYEAGFKQQAAAGFIRPFDLAKAPLLRTGWLRSENKKNNFLLVDMHHIIADAVSIEILAEEFKALCSGQDLPGLRLQYRDYAAWQGREESRRMAKEQGAYWLKRFAHELPVLNLPVDYPRPAVQSYAGSSINFLFSPAEREIVRKTAQETGTTLYMVILSLYHILLSKLSGDEDIVVGTPAAARRHADLSSIIGMFVNTLPIRSYPAGRKSYGEFLQEVKKEALAAFENQEYPFELLVEKLQVQRDTDRSPVFAVMFNLLNQRDYGQEDLEQFREEEYLQKEGAAKYDLTLTLIDRVDKLYCCLTYCSKLFKPGTIKRFAGYFRKLLAQISENKEKPIADIEIISPAEKRQLLYEFNETAASYQLDKAVHELFAEQAEKQPGKIAVVFEDNNMSYYLLHKTAGQLSGFLRRRGISYGSTVGIMVERSLEMIIGILGILKSGAVYLPIEPEYPEKRKHYILRDSGAEILLTNRPLKSPKVETVSIEKCRGEALPFCSGNECFAPTSNLQPAASPLNLAYIIYTSGSTGIAKGVLIEHGSLLNHLAGISRSYCLDDSYDYILLSSLCFDASLKQFLLPLICGGRVNIFKDTADIEKLSNYIEVRNIGVLNGTPSLFKALVSRDRKQNAAVKYVFIGGEKLDKLLAAEVRYKYPRSRIINLYGPTEAAVNALHYEIAEKSSREPLLGKGVPNYRIYILGRYLELLPVGVAGELHISGIGLSRGYLNNPELTAEKFVRNVISHSSLVISSSELSPNDQCPMTNDLLYKTGDLSRWLPDGNIEFLGRIDQQVKIRGYRIEPGEIENLLLKYPGIKEALVLDKQDEQGEQYLCAYIVSSSAVDMTALRKYLSLEFPAYMIPSYFVELAGIPLTPTGKIDRKALPEPEKTGPAEYVAPRSEIEKRLVEIWQDILFGKKAEQTSTARAKGRIGINANFFESGGHSLKAANLTARIHKEFDVKIPLVEIFKNPTIAAMAGFITQAQRERYSALQAVEKKEYYALSSAQERMYILQQLAEASTAYNISGVVNPGLEITKEDLKAVFKKLIERHQVLRTSFEMVKGEPVQLVHHSADMDFEIEYYEPGFKQQPAAGFIRPFDLAKAPLLRAGWLRSEDKNNDFLLVDMHHIIADAISIEVLAEEFKALCSGQDLPGLRLQYRDYAAWQGREEHRHMLKKQEAYWLNRFAHEVPVLNLPVDYPRPAVQSYAGSSINFLFSPGETKIVIKTAQETGTTLYMVILSLYSILLSKLSGDEDIVVGTPAAARRHADLNNIIGMFVNTLPVRSYPLGRKSYREYFNEVKQTALEAFEHQEYPFELLVEKLQVQRDTGRSPVFAVMFNLLNQGDYARDNLEQPEADEYLQKEGVAKFDLTLTIIDRGDKLYADFEYCSKLFKPGTIRRFTGYFRKLLAQISENKEKSIADIEIITAAEKQQLLYEFNDTEVSNPLNGTIHELFAGWVEKTPDSIAVVCADKRISYRQLHKRADRLAGVLKGKGVKPGTIVGIMAGRSLEMIVGIFGILKSGAAYLPIEPGYPEERKHYLLKDSEAEFLLTARPLKNLQVETVLIEERRGEALTFCSGNECFAPTCSPQPAASSSNPAYIIYTSGSTGFPKGVFVEHGPVVNLLFALQKQYPLIESDTYLFKTSYMFDVSVTELFGWYLAGGKLSILTPGGEKDPYLILDEIEKNKVTHINFVPSMFNAFVDILTAANTARLSQLKYIFLAGEALPSRLVDKFNSFALDISLENLYGPTEATVYASLYSLPGSRVSRDIPIGKPVSGVNLFILDRYDKVQGVGIAGELCIGGAGLSRGYLNRLELTAEKFIAAQTRHGFHMSYTSYKSYLYKTGDLARWLPDGNIEFLGRKDQQVKIRGFRVELAEIESLLLKESGIEEAVVIAIEEELGQNYLCGYIVSQHELNIPELKNKLSNSLPGYMIPTHFVRLDRIPLTVSGKIDRKLLPAPEFAAGADYIAPRNDMEKRLAEIWSQVLKIDKSVISIHGNFFAYGGHSLKATLLAARIHREFDVKIPLIEIFGKATIAGLAGYLIASHREKFAAIEPVEKKEYYKLSSAQKRMYILQRLDVGSTTYNIPGMINIGSGITGDKLTGVFKKLIARHESLRTSFAFVNEEPVQQVHKPDDIPFEIECLERGSKQAAYNFVRSFDLTKASLLRAGLSADKGNLMLLVDMHHIISDGMSLRILEAEFQALCRQQKLADLKLRYRDYVAWQDSTAYREMLGLQEEYWLKKYAREVPVLNLPLDYPRPAVQQFSGSKIDFILNEVETEITRRIARQTGTTLYMVILSFFYILLSKLSGEEDIVIGSPAAARRHADLEPIIGMFVNTLPVRNNPAGNKSYREFLQEIRGTTLEAYENQEYQFEDLVDRLFLSRDTGRNPVFDVAFNHIDQSDNPGSSSGELAIGDFEFNRAVSKFDMTLTSLDYGDSLLFSLSYCTRLFKPGTIERFISYFRKIITGLSENLTEKIFALEIISPAEKKLLLHEFNKTKTDFPKDKTVHELFVKQAEKHPGKIAVVFEDSNLSYGAMDQRTNRLAKELRKNNVQANTIVGLMLDRSLETLVGIMAILKAGGAYLPIEIDYPPERKRYMICDSNTEILVTQAKYMGRFSDISLLLNIDDDRHFRHDAGSLKSFNDAGDIIYVIYTSGSTGMPKGVLTTHYNVVRVVRDTNYIELTGNDSILQLSNYAFDGSVFDIYGALLNGAKLAMISRHHMFDLKQLSALIVKERVSVFFITTAMFNTLVDIKIDCFEKVRNVLFGGERVSVEHVVKAFNYMGQGKIIHVYGPTETTVYASYYYVNDINETHYTVPIGSPIANTMIYIYDRNFKPVPCGAAGEIYIGGDGVARGYLNNPELTAEKFVRNVISHSSSVISSSKLSPNDQCPMTNDLLYKTGDLSRRLPDGNIEFLGRIDQQVKIRGFRIEPGEIENRLLDIPGIKEAVVFVKEDENNEKYLCAYVVANERTKNEEYEIDFRKVKEMLAKNLPDYMIPSYFVQLEQFPLNPNGKIETRALPEPELVGEEYTAPTNETERKLAAIWAEVLQVEKERIGIDHDFFALGGHSLKATVLAAKIYHEMGTDLKLVEIFKHPTIREIANLIEIIKFKEKSAVVKERNGSDLEKIVI